MKHRFLYILDFLRILLPDFWIQLYPYSKSWDVKLNHLMQLYEFVEIGSHTAKLEDCSVWITNYPHAIFHPYGPGTDHRVRAKRVTILRAWRKLKADASKSPEEIKRRQNELLHMNKIRRDAHIIKILEGVRNKKIAVNDAAYTIISYKEAEEMQ